MGAGYRRILRRDGGRRRDGASPQQLIADDDGDAEQHQQNTRIEAERQRAQMFAGDVKSFHDTDDQMLGRETGEHQNQAADERVRGVMAHPVKQLFHGSRMLSHVPLFPLTELNILDIPDREAASQRKSAQTKEMSTIALMELCEQPPTLSTGVPSRSKATRFHIPATDVTTSASLSAASSLPAAFAAAAMRASSSGAAARRAISAARRSGVKSLCTMRMAPPACSNAPALAAWS